ncbi:MAG: hypothetical protein AMXMBFR84_40950 [Candidatus Hydrogenedentota bacterium]
MASRRYLYFTVFMGGLTTLAVEFTASRMLQTVYGTSNLVWANVIGVVLAFLTLGYFLGGRIADKNPDASRFYVLVALAGFSSVFFLLLTSALLKTGAAAMAQMNVGAIAGCLVGVLFALAIPVTLLGCLSPFAIRLAVRDVAEAGRISGRIYAVSTWGSILGAYVPVLFVIPMAGSRLSALIFGGLLLCVGIVGALQSRPRKAYAVLLLPLLLAPPSYAWAFGSLKNSPGQIFEKESAYNYIEIIRKDNCTYLYLNEGAGFHSLHCEDADSQPQGVYTALLVAPFMRTPTGTFPEVRRVAVVGLAAGTISHLYDRFFHPAQIDGIELDPEIVDAGRRYFDMNEPNLNVIIGDGRYELNRQSGPYDVVVLDAYKVPYIPWHLTTAEFFEEIRSKLSDDGVVSLNVVALPNDRRLVEAIAATMRTVYPSVHVFNVPWSMNNILVATVQETSQENLVANIAALPEDTSSVLVDALAAAAQNFIPGDEGGIVFRDERAPVESIVDSTLIRYLLTAMGMV